MSGVLEVEWEFIDCDNNVIAITKAKTRYEAITHFEDVDLTLGPGCKIRIKPNLK